MYLFDDEGTSRADDDEYEVEVAISNFFDGQVVELVPDP